MPPLRSVAPPFSSLRRALESVVHRHPPIVSPLSPSRAHACPGPMRTCCSSAHPSRSAPRAGALVASLPAHRSNRSAPAVAQPVACLREHARVPMAALYCHHNTALPASLPPSTLVRFHRCMQLCLASSLLCAHRGHAPFVGHRTCKHVRTSMAPPRLIPPRTMAPPTPVLCHHATFPTTAAHGRCAVPRPGPRLPPRVHAPPLRSHRAWSAVAAVCPARATAANLPPPQLMWTGYQGPASVLPWLGPGRAGSRAPHRWVPTAAVPSPAGIDHRPVIPRPCSALRMKGRTLVVRNDYFPSACCKIRDSSE